MNCVALINCSEALIPSLNSRGFSKSFHCFSGPYAGLIEAAVAIIQYTGLQIIQRMCRGKLAELIPLNGEKPVIWMNGYTSLQKSSFLISTAFLTVYMFALLVVQGLVSLYNSYSTDADFFLIEGTVTNCRSALPANTNTTVINALNHAAQEVLKNIAGSSLSSAVEALTFTTVCVLPLMWCSNRTTDKFNLFRVLFAALILFNIAAYAFQTFSIIKATECRFNADKEIAVWTECLNKYNQE